MKTEFNFCPKYFYRYNAGKVSLVSHHSFLVDSIKLEMTCERCWVDVRPLIHDQHFLELWEENTKATVRGITGNCWEKGKDTLVFSILILWLWYLSQELKPAIGSVFGYGFESIRVILKFLDLTEIEQLPCITHFFLVCQSLKVNSFSSPKRHSFHWLYQYAWASGILNKKPSEKTFFCWISSASQSEPSCKYTEVNTEKPKGFYFST